MLDFTQVNAQLGGIRDHLAQQADASRVRLARARSLVAAARDRRDELVERVAACRDALAFAPAEPVEPVDFRATLPEPPPVHSVLATDGSQISPSHHEVAYCYLINVGRVAIPYGTGRYPLLDSQPTLYYRPADLYAGRQWGLKVEEWMGWQRSIAEAEHLADLGEAFGPAGEAGTAGAPVLALADGSSIHWSLETLPNAARDRLLPPMFAAWERLRAAEVPLLSYVSASRSLETSNFLRLPACPYESFDCDRHCPEGADDAPCNVLLPLRDPAIWNEWLAPGQRGALWKTGARICDRYPEPIYFCYVHVGAEIARVEAPEWLARDRDRLHEALALMLAQVHKGRGYPVALAEAHNQAVVRGPDRARFYLMLERQMIAAGLKNVGTSYKEARKRGSIA